MFIAKHHAFGYQYHNQFVSDVFKLCQTFCTSQVIMFVLDVHVTAFIVPGESTT
jgi:hypothetical protein